MRDFLFLLLALYVAGFATAQVGVVPAPAAVSDLKANEQRTHVLEQAYLDRQNQASITDRQKAEEEAAARYQRSILYDKAKHFVQLWTQLVDGMDHNTANPKLAKKVAQAFHELEKTEGWPARKEK